MQFSALYDYNDVVRDRKKNFFSSRTIIIAIIVIIILIIIIIDNLLYFIIQNIIHFLFMVINNIEYITKFDKIKIKNKNYIHTFHEKHLIFLRGLKNSEEGEGRI